MPTHTQIGYPKSHPGGTRKLLAFLDYRDKRRDKETFYIEILKGSENMKVEQMFGILQKVEERKQRSYKNF